MILHLVNREQIIASDPKPATCFLAHPYTRADWGDNLVTDLEDCELNCLSPFQTTKIQGFLQTVLDAAMDTYLFLFDLTQYNLNVVFELGLIAGLGLPFVIMKDDNVVGEFGVPRLIRDIRQVRFQSREDIVNECFEILSGKCKRDHNYEYISPFNIRETPLENRLDMIYYPMHSIGDDYKAVLKVLRNIPHNLNIETINPFPSYEGQLERYLEAICQSNTNVIRFIPPNEREQQELNLDAALLAGLSYGAGKRTICIVPAKLDGLLSDIRSSSVLYTSERDLSTNLLNVVNSFVSKLHEEAYARSVSKRQQQTKQKEFRTTKRLGELRFGDTEAKTDRYLLDCYIEWPFFMDIVEGQRSFIVGRKGTGKTAIKLIFENNILDPEKDFHLSIEPLEEELEALYSCTHDISNSNIPRLAGTATRIWGALLPIYLVLSVKQSILNCLSQSDVANVIKLHDDIFKHMGLSTSSFISISSYAAFLLRQVIELDSEYYSPDYFIEGYISLAKRSNAILKELSDNGFKGYVLVDSLDQSWNTRSPVPISFVSGLIQAIQYIVSHRYFRCVLMIRLDMFNSISRTLPESDKILKVNLEWTPERLKRLITDRIKAQHYKSSFSPEQYERLIFEARKGKTSLDYILKNIDSKPREAIRMCTYCWDRALQEGRVKISNQDVKALIPEMASNRLVSLGIEYRNDIPWLEQLLLALIDTSGEFTLDEWCEFIDTKCDNANVRSDYGESLSDVASIRDQITEDVIRLGLIEVLENEELILSGHLPSSGVIVSTGGIMGIRRRKSKRNLVYRLTKLYRPALLYKTG